MGTHDSKSACNTQLVERIVKLVTEKCVQTTSYETRHDHASFVLESRNETPYLTQEENLHFRMNNYNASFKYT